MTFGNKIGTFKLQIEALKYHHTFLA